MSKDKKKKGKKDKKGSKSDAGLSASSAKFTKRLQAISDNPLVADVVAAALVATASALKDSKKARLLANHAGDELEKLAKEGAQRGNAMWKLALDIGRKSLEAMTAEDQPRKAARAKSSRKHAKPKSPKPVKRTAAKPRKNGTRKK